MASQSMAGRSSLSVGRSAPRPVTPGSVIQYVGAAEEALSNLESHVVELRQGVEPVLDVRESERPGDLRDAKTEPEAAPLCPLAERVAKLTDRIVQLSVVVVGLEERLKI